MHTVELPVSGVTLEYDPGTERWHLLQPDTGRSQWQDAGPKSTASFIDLDRPGQDIVWVAFGNLATPGPVHVTFDHTVGTVTTIDGTIWASECVGPISEVRANVAGESHRLRANLLAKMRLGH